MNDGCSDLALDVVADDRDPCVGEALRPNGIGRDEHGNGVYEGHAGFEGLSRVELLCLLRSDWEVGNEHLGAGVDQPLPNVDRCSGRFVDGLAVVATEPVECWSALNLHVGDRNVREADRVVLPGKDGFGELGAYLFRINVERGHELHVADVIATERDVHQARHGVGWTRRPCSTPRPGEGSRRSCPRRRSRP